MWSIEANFNRLALLDDEGWTANNYYHHSLLQCVPPNCENALEIGCGTGAFARRLAKTSKRVIAIDMSPHMVQVARRNREETLVVAILHRLPKTAHGLTRKNTDRATTH